MEISAEVQKYETKINDVLRPDLRKEVEHRDQICERLATYSQLEQTIDCIKKVDTTDGLRTQVNIGSNFYAQAHIPDTSRIYVDIGLGLHLEMTLVEAKKFCSTKVDSLAKTIQESSKRSAKIKSHIKLITEMLRQLQTKNAIKD